MTCKYWVYYNISDEDKFHIIDFFSSTCEITWHYKNSEVMCLDIHVLCYEISCFDLSKNICIEHIIYLILKNFKYINFFLFLIWNIILIGFISACPFTICRQTGQRVFYPQNKPCTFKIVGTFYMQGYKH